MTVKVFAIEILERWTVSLFFPTALWIMIVVGNTRGFTSFHPSPSVVLVGWLAIWGLVACVYLAGILIMYAVQWAFWKNNRTVHDAGKAFAQFLATWLIFQLLLVLDSFTATGPVSISGSIALALICVAAGIWAAISYYIVPRWQKRSRKTRVITQSITVGLFLLSWIAFLQRYI